MTADDPDDIDDIEFEALWNAIDANCIGYPTSMVRWALCGLLAETFAQVPIAHRDTKLRYDLGLIRAYVSELPP